MTILEKLSVLTLFAWDSSPELQERHQGDSNDYYQRVLRQAMDCDENEIPVLITDVLSPEQIANALQLTGVKSV